MPELAEVEYYKRRWEPSLGERVVSVSLHEQNRIFRGTPTAALASQIKGTRFQQALTHGKQMVFRFGVRGWVGIHLGMAGKLLREPTASYVPHKHDHLVIQTGKACLVFRDTRYFGRVLWFYGKEDPPWWAHRGPDILSPQFSHAYFDRILDKRPGSPIKPLLLNQDAFPGIGNWMADEILWRAAIHPATRTRRLDPNDRRILYAKTREVCRAAMKVIAPDWSTPPKTWLFTHRWKDGGTCPKTGEPLLRIEVGGRTTCFSPARQGAKPKG
ncbi:MAG: DNA-formamidopyrimidine glycosylase family protein [Verrucomicrobiota bacterium]